MTKNKLASFTCLILLMFVAYAPWHDAPSLGTRLLLADIGPLKSITLSGVLNFFWISVVGSLLSIKIFRSFRHRSPTKLEILIAVNFLFVLANTRTFDTHSIIAIENLFFLSILFVSVLRSEFFQTESISKYVIPVFITSYAFAILLPFLIPIKDHEIFSYFNETRRFIGWVGEGTPIAFCGFTLCVYALTDLFFASKRPLKISILAIPLGFLGIFLNVNRTSIIALILFVLVSFFIVYRANVFKTKKRSQLLPVAILLTAAIVLLTGQFAIKSGIFREPKTDIAVNSSHPASLDKKWINSNGRIITAIYLLKQVQKRELLFGKGTGSTPRTLKKVTTWNPDYPITTVKVQNQTQQAQNEYLRIFFDHGFIGLLLILTIMVILAYEMRKTIILPIIISVLFCMLTDNFLLFPTFGYGPVFLTGLFFVTRSMISDKQRPS